MTLVKPSDLPIVMLILGRSVWYRAALHIEVTHGAALGGGAREVFYTGNSPWYVDVYSDEGALESYFQGDVHKRRGHVLEYLDYSSDRCLAYYRDHP